MADSRSVETEDSFGIESWGSCILDFKGIRRARVFSMREHVLHGRVYLYDPRKDHPAGLHAYDLGSDPYPTVYRWLLQGILPT